MPGRVVLGHLQLVRSVSPFEVRFKDPETLTPRKGPSCEQGTPAEGIESDLSWLPEADLSGLTVKQKEQARQLLVEEADVFATSYDDVGCLPKLEMDIRLTSDQPVQKKRSNCEIFHKEGLRFYQGWPCSTYIATGN